MPVHGCSGSTACVCETAPRSDCPEHVRIGVRRVEDCRRLAGAMQEAMAKSDG